jgi:dipeptidyl aminopeptidase/acylaminoacyl peptidase
LKSTTIRVLDRIKAKWRWKNAGTLGGVVGAFLFITTACDDTSAPAPALHLEADSLSFSFVHRQETPETQYVSIDNIGGGELRWTAEAEPDWVAVDPLSGTAPTTIAVRVDSAGLIVGDYAGVIRISAENDVADSVIVTLDVEGAPPSGISFQRLKNASTVSDTVFIVGADGGGLRPFLVDTALQGAIAWAPDGERLAFTRGPDRLHAELYAAFADGRDDRLLVTPPSGMGVLGPGWSPEGSEIIYERYDDTGPISRFDLWIVTVATGEVREFRRLGVTAAWSPDGEWIAFDGQSDLIVRRVDGTAENVLISDHDVIGPSWSPDGRRIVYQTRVNGDEWDLNIIDVETGEVEVLTDAREWDDTGPQWSPDGSRILFTRRVHPAELTDPCRLFTMAPDGTSLREVPNTEGAFFGQWRPWVAPGAGRR